MEKTIIQLISLIIVAIAIVLIFDARDIAVKHFSKDEKYSAIKMLKVVGIIIAWIGMGMLYMSIK